jgi:hypothetical protein
MRCASYYKANKVKIIIGVSLFVLGWIFAMMVPAVLSARHCTSPIQGALGSTSSQPGQHALYHMTIDTLKWQRARRDCTSVSCHIVC